MVQRNLGQTMHEQKSQTKKCNTKKFNHKIFIL